MRTASSPASMQRCSAGGMLRTNEFDGFGNRDRSQQRLSFATLPERYNAVRHALQMGHRYARQLLRAHLKSDAGLRRRQTRARLQLRDASDAARVAFRRYG